MEEKGIIFAPELYWQFEKHNNYPVFYPVRRKCDSCGQTVMGLIMDIKWNAEFFDARAIINVVLRPLTRVVFGIHNNLFYAGFPVRSRHFAESAHYVYVCKKCVDGIAEKIALCIPEIKDRFLAGEVIDEPEFDLNAEGKDVKGCWITVEEFDSTSTTNKRVGFLNYQTNLKRFDEIISAIGVDLGKIL